MGSGWVPISTSKNSIRKSKVICFDFSSGFDVGSYVTWLPYTDLPDQPVLTKPEDWGTEQSKGMLSTESVCDVVAVRGLSQKEQLMVSQGMKVSTRSSFNGEFDRRLRREPDGWLVHFEC